MNILQRILPLKMQVFLMRMSPWGLSVSCDRLLGRKIFVFHISLAGQASYITPVIKELNKHHKKISIRLVTDRSLYSIRAELSALTTIPPSRIFPWNRLYLIIPIDAFITPTQWIHEPPDSKLRICIFHGQPTKGNTFQADLMRNFNTLFLLGPMHKSLYDSFADTHTEIASAIKTFPVGYPKSDDLLNGCFSREDVLNDLSLDPLLPVILYAPAFDKGTSLDMYGDQVIDKLLEINASIIVKLHPMCYDQRYYPDGINWTERLKKFDNHPRFRHVGNKQLDSFLTASDVLVTDTSGAALEFMLLNKPVIFIDCPDFFMKTLGQDGYERAGHDVLQDIRANAGRSAGIVVENPSQLPDAVARCLDFPSEYEQQRLVVQSQLLYNPGKASSVAADVLRKLVFEEFK